MVLFLIAGHIMRDHDCREMPGFYNVRSESHIIAARTKYSLLKSQIDEWGGGVEQLCAHIQELQRMLAIMKQVVNDMEKELRHS